MEKMLRLVDVLQGLSSKLNLNLSLILREGASKEFPLLRDFAYTYQDGNDYIIVVAPKLDRQSKKRQEGIILHELAHIVLLSRGHPNHSEREADSLVREEWGIPIAYDSQDVQTTGKGTYPRPSHLHQ